ncbi:MAG TPA: oligosaccharide flippase family protein [Candidatus Methylomirabilis sp.]|nr:oligosaccharide flippase family protein [Candidatus Methylomirabilis sp.]
MINFLKNNAFARNSLILFAGSVLANLLNYFFHLIIGRLVSVEIYGQTESLISLIAIISVPAATLGLVATKFAAAGKAENNPESSRSLMKYLNRQVFIYGLPIFLLALALTPLLDNFLRIPSFYPLAIIWTGMFLSFFVTINLGILSGWQKFVAVSENSVLSALIKFVFGVTLVTLGFRLNAIVGSFAVAGVAAYLASIIMLKFLRTAPNASRNGEEKKINFQPVKNYVWPVFVGSLAINILGNIDMIFAKHNLNSILAGQYGALNVISKVIFFITGIIASVLFAMAAEHSHKKTDSAPILKNALALTLLFCALAVIFYFFFPSFVLSVFFGSKYLSVGVYLGWFAVSASLFSLANLILQYLLSIHETKIANIYLVLSILAGALILLLGKSIFAILIMISLANLAGVLIGAIFLYRQRFSALAEETPAIINYIE